MYNNITIPPPNPRAAAAAADQGVVEEGCHVQDVLLLGWCPLRVQRKLKVSFTLNLFGLFVSFCFFFLLVTITLHFDLTIFTARSHSLFCNHHESPSLHNPNPHYILLQLLHQDGHRGGRPTGPDDWWDKEEWSTHPSTWNHRQPHPHNDDGYQPHMYQQEPANRF